MVEDFEVAISQGQLAGAVSHVLAKPLPFFNSTPLHIAVVGEPGSGKSSFINAMLGLRADDPQVILWDHPRRGTPTFGEDKFEKVDLNHFDFFIIVGSQRFRSTHSDLVREIQDMGKSFYFVRTKADLDLSAAKRQQPSDYNEKKVLLHIQEDCKECLVREGVRDPQVFIVSNWEADCFDFPLLQETLKNDLLRLKRQAFLLRFPSICLAYEYHHWEHFPIFGFLLSGGISLLRTYFMLQKCISGAVDDTQRVLAKALEAEGEKSI
ncbi:interferon-inducible GTPase 5-like [Podarcis muralis]